MATNDALYIIDAGSRERTSSLEAHPNRYSSFRSSPTSKSFPSFVINELKTLNNQSKKMKQMTNMVVITIQSLVKIIIFSLVSIIKSAVF